MRKLFIGLPLLTALFVVGSVQALSIAPVSTKILPVNTQLENIDTQLENADTGTGEATFSAYDFKMQTFSSCNNFQDVVRTYLSGAFQRYGNSWHGRPYYRGGVMFAEDSVAGIADKVAAPTLGQSVSNSVSTNSNAGATDWSSTNIQVAGVDEGEAIKSDGKNLYYYNATDKLVYIVKAYPATEMEVLKKIKLPASFGEPELYVADGRLTIVASKWVEDPLAGRRWVDRSSKTAVAVYNLADPAHPKLERYLQVDGSYARSRRVGDRLYILSQSSLRVPYDTYVLPYYSDTEFHPDTTNFNKDLKSLAASDVLPRKTEIRLVAEGQGNISVAGKAVPYQAVSAAAANCNAVEYTLPDEETLKKFNTDPEFVTITSINLSNSSAAATSKVVFGNLSEIYLGEGDLYLASHLYSSRPWRCPVGAYCIMPYFQTQENTLLHKFSMGKDTVTYKASTVLPGTPLNQYAMDAHNGYFRMVTKTWAPNQETAVYVLDANLKKTGSITEIAKGEDFKTARFVGDRLYLVTFQQIDPLFTISLADPKNPQILGELKIPGYSTYLHPYDENTLIGLGYGTKTNQWGGVQNSGLKVDLYDVSDIKNPKQKYTFDLGEQGSYSDALNNPRLFVWKESSKQLFLPVTLYWKKDATSYENKDAFQGVVVLSVDKTKGISQLAQLTHIDSSGIGEKRIQDCKQYSVKADVPQCRKLLDGTQFCTDPATQNRWVPEYCYADATDGAYFAAQMWNWSRDFIKRTAFMDNWVYTVADSGVKSWDSNRLFTAVSSVDFK